MLYQGLARIALKAAATAKDSDVLLDALDTVRVVEHLLAAAHLDERISHAGRQLRAWAAAWRRQLRRVPAGQRIAAYALRAALWRVHKESDAKTAPEVFITMVRAEVLMAHVDEFRAAEAEQRQKQPTGASTEEGDSDGDVPSAGEACAADNDARPMPKVCAPAADATCSLSALLLIFGPLILRSNKSVS